MRTTQRAAVTGACISKELIAYYRPLMPANLALDRRARQASYLQYGSSLVDRRRTRLVQREILKRLPRTGSLRVLDLGCGYHAIYLKAVLKAIGGRLAEGVGVDFH